jgi:hypothetical protein
MHSEDHCTYSIHKVFSVFTNRCLVVASNGGRFPSSGFLNCPWLQLPPSHFSQLQLSTDSTNHSSQSQSYVMTNGQSVSLSWCQAPIWDLRPNFFFCLRVVGSLIWGAFSYGRTGLSLYCRMYNIVTCC